jgi:hypothetical protein
LPTPFKRTESSRTGQYLRGDGNAKAVTFVGVFITASLDLTIEAVKETLDPLLAERLCGPFHCGDCPGVDCATVTFNAERNPIHEAPLDCEGHQRTGEVVIVAANEEKPLNGAKAVDLVRQLYFFKQSSIRHCFSLPCGTNLSG